MNRIAARNSFMRFGFAMLLLCLLPVASYASADRSLQAISPAAGINKVILNAGVGELHVKVSPDDSVHVKVTLERKSSNFLWFFHWGSENSERQIEHVTLQRQKQKAVLSYALDYPRHLDDGDVKQRWDVEVPARLALKIIMKVGQVNVDDVAGGVDVSLNVGDINLHTPRGPMTASVNVGQITATSGTDRPGNIKLDTTLGDVHLHMQGWKGDDARSDGLGRSINVKGQGPDNMAFEVNIGEAGLRIEPAHTAGTEL